MTPEILNLLKNEHILIGKQRTVFELGSYNVNGSARSVIDHKEWLGADISEGPDVDIVVGEREIYRHILTQRSYYPDTFVCCECLEHVKDPIAAVNELKLAMKTSNDARKARRDSENPESLLIITAPTYGFPYHGYPKDYWRFTSDTLLDVFFSDLKTVQIGHLNSNEGWKTTVYGFAVLR